MAGGMCLPSSQRNTPISDHQFPYHNPIHSPVMTRSSFINMKSPIIAKQRPKTDMLSETIQTLSGRPKTAKLHPLRHLSQGNRIEKVTQNQNVNKMKENHQLDDYLSQKCNHFDMSDGDPNLEAPAFLRDDEEYYLNMDPVEYFYSPIIDIFPIATITAKMKPDNQPYLDESLQSSSHFLPVIDTLKEADRPTLTPLHRHSHSKLLYHDFADDSRKSSFQSLIAPSFQVKKKINLCSERKDSFQRTVDGISVVSYKRTSVTDNDTKDLNECSEVPNKQITEVRRTNGAKQKTRIPIAQSYFLHQDKADFKLPELQSRSPISLRANIKQRNASKLKTDVTPSLRHPQERRILKPIIKQNENHIKRRKLPSQDAKKTNGFSDIMGMKDFIWKDGSTWSTPKRDNKLPQINCEPNLTRDEKIYDSHVSLVDEPAIDPIAAFPETSTKAKNQVHFESFSVLRKQLSMSRRQSDDGSNSNGSPKLLSDSTVALTSSKRPFTDERNIIHEEGKGQNTLAFVFPKRETNTDVIVPKEDAMSKSRPKSDKNFKDITYNNKFPFPRKLKPLKTRHNFQTHF